MSSETTASWAILSSIPDFKMAHICSLVAIGVTAFVALFPTVTKGCQEDLGHTYSNLDENVTFAFSYDVYRFGSFYVFHKMVIENRFSEILLQVEYDTQFVLDYSQSDRVNIIGDFYSGNLTFVLLQVLPSDHGEIRLRSEYEGIIQCAFLYVFVPLTSLSITDPDGNSLPDSAVAVREDSAGMTVVCSNQPNGSRPLANITFWKGHGFDEPVEITTNVSITTNISDEYETVSSSKLVVADRSYNNLNVYCIATTNETSMTSSLIRFDVQYGPGHTISVAKAKYVITEGSRVDPIACQANCNPDCSFKWTRAGRETLSDSAILDFRLVDKFDAGTYECEAYVYILGDKVSSKATTEVVVHYEPEIDQLIGGGTYDINSTVSLTCMIDSVPTPIVKWYKQGEVTPLKSENKTTSYLTLESINCEEMAIYTCAAENYLGKTEENVELLVKCHPIESTPHDPNVYGQRGSELRLTVNILSFRLPSFTWSDPDQEKITPDNDLYTQVDNGHSSILTIHGLEKFGTYRVRVSNEIKPDAVFEFHLAESEFADSSDVGAIIGAAAGAFAFGLILMSFVWVMFVKVRGRKCCKERSDTKPQTDNEEHTYYDLREPDNPQNTAGEGHIQMDYVNGEEHAVP